jgi:hypothetical protein
MVRSLTLITALSLALAPVAHAADTTPPDVLAKFQQTALASCNHDLDAGRFDWASIDECTAYKTAKLQDAYQTRQASRSAASPRAH